MKLISITRGYFVMVDDEDFERINQFKWYYNHGRAARTIQIGYKDLTKPKRSSNQIKTHVLMHRIIMNAPVEYEVDHKDMNQLNNQKSNLRLCTSSQNKANKRKGSRNKHSSYKGIEYIFSYKGGKRYLRKKPWLVRMHQDGKRIYIGYFEKEIEAAKAYDKAAKELYGEFARTNF